MTLPQPSDILGFFKTPTSTDIYVKKYRAKVFIIHKQAFTT